MEVKYLPNASMKVLLPAPGTPVMPILIEFPEKGRLFSIICLATSVSRGALLSISVIA
jgi:hypothetical protein